MPKSAEQWAADAERSPVRTIIKATLIVVLVGAGIGWLVQGNQFFLYKAFAPKQEAVRREVFEQSRAFNQGMIQELENMQMQYVQADSTAKVALASIILHRASGYNLEDPAVPQSLRVFVNDLKRERGLAR